jgi:hypothetical protein
MVPGVDFINITRITYGGSKIRCTVIRCMHALMQFFQNALAYFETAVKCLLS